MTLGQLGRRRWPDGRLPSGPVVSFVAGICGYAALARLGFQLVGSSGGMGSFWPPVGWIVGLLVLAPPRTRPWVLAAVLPGELIADLSQGDPLSTALGWGATDVAETALAAWLLLKLAGRRPLGDRERDLVALALAAMAAPLVTGLLGAAVSQATYGGSYGQAWLTWWLGDATGILLVVPLVLSFAQTSRQARRPTELLELGLVVGVAISIFAFTTVPIQFLLLPPLVLLAVRHGLRLTAVGSLLVAIVAAVCTGRNLGPFAGQTGESRILGLQAFIATTAFIVFLICATLSERRTAETALADLATHDPLTGLANRRSFMARLDETTARRFRSTENAAVVYLDLDRFKEINDDLGHAAGDAVLAEVGRRLCDAAREGDLVARIGGDEFAVLLEPVDGIDGAELFAKRIAQAVERPFAYNDVTISISCSIGAALTTGNSDTSLRRADEQLYRDKNRRRHTSAPSPAREQHGVCGRLQPTGG